MCGFILARTAFRNESVLIIAKLASDAVRWQKDEYATTTTAMLLMWAYGMFGLLYGSIKCVL